MHNFETCIKDIIWFVCLHYSSVSVLSPSSVYVCITILLAACPLCCWRNAFPWDVPVGPLGLLVVSHQGNCFHRDATLPSSFSSPAIMANGSLWIYFFMTLHPQRFSDLSWMRLWVTSSVAFRLAQLWARVWTRDLQASPPVILWLDLCFLIRGLFQSLWHLWK